MFIINILEKEFKDIYWDYLLISFISMLGRNKWKEIVIIKVLISFVKHLLRLLHMLILIGFRIHRYWVQFKESRCLCYSIVWSLFRKLGISNLVILDGIIFLLDISTFFQLFININLNLSRKIWFNLYFKIVWHSQKIIVNLYLGRWKILSNLLNLQIIWSAIDPL